MKHFITTIICVFAFFFASANIQIIETIKSLNGDCTGSIVINATGEAGPFTFSLVNNSGPQPTIANNLTN